MSSPYGSFRHLTASSWKLITITPGLKFDIQQAQFSVKTGLGSYEGSPETYIIRGNLFRTEEDELRYYTTRITSTNSI